MTVDVEALARCVARLEAIEVAKVTAARYGRACDAKDLDMLRNEVFTPDIVLRLPNDRSAEGVDTVVHFYRSAFESEPGIRRRAARDVLEHDGSNRDRRRVRAPSSAGTAPTTATAARKQAGRHECHAPESLHLDQRTPSVFVLQV